ncbi:hypothetical protein [Yimella sp. NH-Cas1]|uniref:hypothetical protein n=1 Tax=Yimella sp. NH-Cas1 TaxID=2917726 RepID=UPI001EFB3D2B|nr:hypothetical protein [Yimella sp. NH-Cas1]MCG8656176.1 hypothetical protein [Yimella sp. NH-Cas1]
MSTWEVTTSAGNVAPLVNQPTTSRITLLDPAPSVTSSVPSAATGTIVVFAS